MPAALLQITGMTCAACSARIEKGLRRMPGVERATVNFALNTAEIEYNNHLALPDILEKVKALGYGATELTKENPPAQIQEIRKIKIRLLFSALFSVPLLWTMVAHFGLSAFLPAPDFLFSGLFQLLLATPVQFLAGGPFYAGAFRALRNKAPNMDVLVAMGTSAAYFYSLVLVLKSLLQDASSVHLPLYFETSAVLITLILAGKFLELQARQHTSDAIKELMQLQPATGTVLRDGKPVEILVENIESGDLLLLRPGERISVDAIVEEGNSYVDESMLTGESFPVNKGPGASLAGGCINQNGSLKARVTRTGQNTLLARIIAIVQKAQAARAPVQRIADRISGFFVPAVLCIAALTFLLWYFMVAPGDFARALENAIAVLVIACPCALGLATPTSIMAGSGRAARAGLLFKGGDILESTQSIGAIIFDKTGTITQGRPSVQAILPFHPDYSCERILHLAATAEQNSEHPLARAILEKAREKQIEPAKVREFQNLPGHGIEAHSSEGSILVGNLALMEKNGLFQNATKNSAPAAMQSFEEKGHSCALIAHNNEFVGIIAIADQLRDEAREVVLKLKSLHISTYLITGDRQTVARAIGVEAGFSPDEIIAGVLPEKKAEHVALIKHAGKKVAMVGDGINDAPALAVADIGIAPGSASGIALETAGITLLRGDLRLLLAAIRISRATLRNIKQNLFWALGYNCLGIPVAAMGLLAPWLAGAAMALSSVSVVLNALRLQRLNID